ncbi:MAG: hypothetical protein EPO22_10210 [Dehalococcoidia bacterium]|nr:MAG: hypothetical protein EPO22_10210 [Dehalococcoidia bacterium]
MLAVTGSIKPIMMLACIALVLSAGCTGSGSTESTGNARPKSVNDVVIAPSQPLEAMFRWDSRLAHGYVFWRQSNGVRRFDLIDGELNAPHAGDFVIEMGLSDPRGAEPITVGCYWLRGFLSSHVDLSCSPGPSPIEQFIWDLLGADLGAYQRTETVMDKVAECYEFHGDLFRGSLCYERSTGTPLTVWILGRDGLDSLEILSISTAVEDFVPPIDLATAASISLPGFERTMGFDELRLPSALGARD